MKLNEVINNPKRIIYTLGMRGIFNFLNDEQYIKLMYNCKFGKKLDLVHPKSFDEKIQWLKLNEKKEICTALVDKCEVKKIVASIIGEKYIIPTLGVWNRFEDIDFNILPNQFVLKCTHDSGGIVICHDKRNLNIEKTHNVINKCFKRNYYWVGREWPYKEVQPRIIAEPLLVDESGEELKDYKVFNFNGMPKLIQVDYDRFHNHRRNLYDTNWTYIPAEILYPTDVNVQITIPECLNELLMLSEKLSKDFIHVRTDFYIINEKIFFGEMTFLHGSGFEEFRPKEFGNEMGSWMKLPIEE